MNHQTLIPGCETPILAALDPGTNGCIVKNLPDGSLMAMKCPQRADGSMDLQRYREALQGVDMLIIEQQSSGGFHGHTRISDNSVFAQYRTLVGFFEGAGIPYYSCRPQAWMKILNFPTKKKVGEDQWKDFLHAQSLQRFPNVRIHKYQADSYLLYKVLTMLWGTDKITWP